MFFNQYNDINHKFPFITIIIAIVCLFLFTTTSLASSTNNPQSNVTTLAPRTRFPDDRATVSSKEARPPELKGDKTVINEYTYQNGERVEYYENLTLSVFAADGRVIFDRLDANVFTDKYPYIATRVKSGVVSLYNVITGESAVLGDGSGGFTFWVPDETGVISLVDADGKVKKVSLKATLPTFSPPTVFGKEGLYFKHEFEILAGARLLLAGKTYSAVNGILTESYKNSADTRKIEFLPGIQRDTDKKTVAGRFCIKENPDTIFEFEYTDTATVKAEISEYRNAKDVPYVTTRDETLFYFKDIKKTAKIIDEYGGFDVLSKEIDSDKGIQPPQYYVNRAFNETEKRISRIFERRLKEHYGKPWRGGNAPDISNLDLNDYLYFLGNLISGHYIDNKDIYENVNIERIELGTEYLKKLAPEINENLPQKEIVQNLLKYVVYGNKIEGAVKIKDETLKIGLDRMEELVQLILSIGPRGQMDLFVDNAGPEFSANLQLCDYLVNKGIVGSVKIHIKAAPYAVSDIWGSEGNAIIPYVERTIESLSKSGDKRVEAISARIKEFFEDGRIKIERNEFLNYEPDFINIAPEVNKALTGSDGAIFIGDALYRKLHGDRDWTHSEDPEVIENVLSYLKVPTGFIRIIKSPIKLGVPLDRPEDGTVGMIYGPIFKEARPGDDISVTDAGLNKIVPLEQLTWGNLFQENDSIKISRLKTSEPMLVEPAEQETARRYEPMPSNNASFTVPPFDTAKLPLFKRFIFMKGAGFGSDWDWARNARYADVPGPDRDDGYVHPGIDFFEYETEKGARSYLPEETPVRAICSGMVVDFADLKTSVYILTSDNKLICYAHIDARVTMGQKINAGEVVGVLRSSFVGGRPHLHMTISDADGNFPWKAAYLNTRLTKNPFDAETKEDLDELLKKEAYFKELTEYREKVNSKYAHSAKEYRKSLPVINPQNYWPHIFKDAYFEEDDAPMKIERAVDQFVKYEDKLFNDENMDEQYLLTKASRYLKTHPANMFIDISSIPKEKDQLEESMNTLASLIAWHNMFGLNVRYVLENDIDGAALEALKSRLSEKLIPFVGAPFTIGETIETRDGKRITVNADELIDIRLRNIAEIKKHKEIKNREYVVALKDDTSIAGTTIPNYTTAAAIGLSLAALRVARDELEKHPENKEEYETFRGKILDKFRYIYARFGIIMNRTEFSEDELELMVRGSSATRLYYTVLYALPPVAKILDGIHKYHEMMRDVLIAA